ncbi:MAG TPA: zinc ribbon domain-containing protein [Candidatus Limnocylindrales bacterium]|nr:zinc ribbon domain-containing protein [Candidatus Limnocylindrales bacterium]
MPLYEYQCKKCHSLMERIQKFSDSPLTVCPHCGGELEQVLSAPAFQFKGSGWYVSDYAKKSSSSSSSSGNGSTSSSASPSKAETPQSETSSGNDTSRSSKDPSNSGKDTSSSSKDKTSDKK